MFRPPSLDAARQRSEPIEHILLYGPPGLGKTAPARIVANAMGSKIVTASYPVQTGIANNLPWLPAVA